MLKPKHIAGAGPSRASKRILVAAAALLGAGIAGRLAAYQIGWTGPPWEPFFGTGTERVLRSSFSRALPFPDAALGLFMYLAEIGAVAWGNTARWRSKPVAVYVYAATAFGLAFGSLGLLGLQAAVIHDSVACAWRRLVCRSCSSSRRRGSLAMHYARGTREASRARPYLNRKVTIGLI